MAEKKSSYKPIAKNKAAHYEYAIEETFECGIVLTGTEVKSMRERSAQITESFVLIRDGEAWIIGMHVGPYSHGNLSNVDSDRRRKLLLHRNEINYLFNKTQLKGTSIIPLKIYFNDDGRVKLIIGLGMGKKLHDKRADMAKRDSDRNLSRALKERNRQS